MIVVKCFQYEQSSGQSLQFPHPTHQNFNFISVSGRFVRIFCLFFMARIQSPPNMGNKVNELSRENLPQQQIVTSSFHQCQQGSASSQCQCHNSNILVNANPSYLQVIQSHNTKALIHNPQKKRSHQGSAYPNIKHYRTTASLMHSTIYLTSSSVT